MTRRARASTERPALARRGRRRSADTTTRSWIRARLASPVSALLEPSRRCDEESARRGDVTRRTAASTERTAYAPRGRQRSVDTATRSRLSARSAAPVSALLEPSRRCDEESRRRDDVTRRSAAHTTRRARASTERPAHARCGRRRSVDTTTRSRLGARSASLVSALIEPRRRCDEESLLPQVTACL